MGGADTMEKKSGLLNVRTYVLGAAAVTALLALLAGLRAVREIRSLRAALEDTQARLAQSEETRVSDLYDLQKELGSLRQEGTSDGYPSEKSLAAALRAGEIESVLVLGDSISDGINDNHCVFGQGKRAERGFRQIMTVGETSYYENDPRGQGWVKYFRDYLLANTSVTTFHNNAIGAKSAKWFNAHKEEAVSQDYDAIVVMLGTNDRRASGPEEFYVEYASLLSYLDGRCKYLQVLTPIPAVDSADPTDTTEFRMDTRQAADVVLELCADKGYAVVNLYGGLIRYARTSGMHLDDFIIDETHPHSTGYLHLWRLIAEELGLNLEIGSVYDSSDIYDSFVCIGANREDITENTRLYDTAHEEDIFPVGISFYWQWESFVSGETYGGTVITYRYKNGGGKQIYKPLFRDYDLSHGYDLIRRANEDGTWSAWSKASRNWLAPES